MDFLQRFVDFINSIIDAIKNLVKSIRDHNDGKDDTDPVA